MALRKPKPEYDYDYGDTQDFEFKPLHCGLIIGFLIGYLFCKFQYHLF